MVHSVAITGAWKARTGVQAGAAKWGTGINPIHAVNDGGGPSSRLVDYGGPFGVSNDIPFTPDLPGGIEGSIEGYGYTHEDDAAFASWGYGPNTGTSDRPGIGSESTARVRTPDEFPSYGEHPNGVPGGTLVRSLDHGAERTTIAKETPNETVGEGWLNKVRSFVNPPGVSHPVQLVVNTASEQLDKQRNGSQVEGQGRASEYDAGIAQIIPGMRVKTYSGGMRHYDMTPKQQEEMLRPWWGRQAGTADPALMMPNAQTAAEPIERTPPEPPDQGRKIPAPQTGGTGSDMETYGYVGEDVIPYA